MGCWGGRAAAQAAPHPPPPHTHRAHPAGNIIGGLDEDGQVVLYEQEEAEGGEKLQLSATGGCWGAHTGWCRVVDRLSAAQQHGTGMGWMRVQT